MDASTDVGMAPPADAGSDAPPDASTDGFGPQYLLVGVTRSPEGRSGYGTIVPSLDVGTEVSLETAVVLPGLGSLAMEAEPEGVFYVGLAESPRIQRFESTPDLGVIMTGEFGLLAAGTPTGAGIMVIANARRGFLFNVFTRNLIVFDPLEMLLIEEVEVDLGQPDEATPYYSNVALIDGERIVITTLGVRRDISLTPHTRAVFVDIETAEVTYADYDGCGGLTSAVKDDAGNLYFGPILRHGSSLVTGTAGEPESPLCVLRIARGATRFDPELIDLFALSGGRPAGVLTQGLGDTAFLLQRRADAEPLTVDNIGEANLREEWSYVSLDLRNPVALEPVPGLERVAGNGISLLVREGDAARPTSFLVRVAEDFSRSTVVDVTNPSEPVERFVTPGSASAVFRLR
ncbi:MAG: hypothetical protein AAGH15_20405 [Myxococcota bacterium]